MSSKLAQTTELLKAFNKLMDYHRHGKYYNGKMWIDFPEYDGNKIKEDFMRAYLANVDTSSNS